MYPKFEKVDDHTIRIINEKADEVKLSNLLENLKQLKEKRDQINQVIANVETILKNAAELGITTEEKERKLTLDEINPEDIERRDNPKD